MYAGAEINLDTIGRALLGYPFLLEEIDGTIIQGSVAEISNVDGGHHIIPTQTRCHNGTTNTMDNFNLPHIKVPYTSQVREEGKDYVIDVFGLGRMTIYIRI